MAVSGLEGLDWGGMATNASSQFILYGVVFLFIIIFGLLLWFIIDYLSYNIHVELLRQIGKPFLDDKGKKKILTESLTKSGKLYQKKQKAGGAIEYFKIKGTDWNYKNYFNNDAFNPREKTSFLDFKKKVIRCFIDPERGLVPIYLSNPGYEVENVSLNEVIGAISDSLHERDNLYASDFWSKYGSAITIAMLITFLVLGMIFVLKYQEVQWAQSMKALDAVLGTLKQQAAPPLEGILQ